MQDQGTGRGNDIIIIITMQKGLQSYEFHPESSWARLVGLLSDSKEEQKQLPWGLKSWRRCIKSGGSQDDDDEEKLCVWAHKDWN